MRAHNEHMQFSTYKFNKTEKKMTKKLLLKSIVINGHFKFEFNGFQKFEFSFKNFQIPKDR